MEPKSRQLAKKLLAFTLFLLAGLGAAAQDSSGAEAAFLKYAQAAKAYDTAAMSALMHPDALKRFRASFNSALAGPKRDQAASELLPLFAVPTVAAYSALSDSEAYKRMNDAIAEKSPRFVEVLATSTYEIVGSFIKDGVAYVTYNLKMTFQGNPVTSQVVQTLRFHDGKWLLMLPATADASIAGIDARYK